MTRVFRRRWRTRTVVLLGAAAVFGLVTVATWWLPVDWRPRSGWAGTEQAGWIAGILSTVLALASFVFDRISGYRERGRERSPLDGVVRVGRLPRQAAWLQDRRARIDLVKAARAGRTAVLTQVLSGMGGVGKTQLAAQFARRLDGNGELDLLLWVTASSRDAIIASYAEAAQAIGLAPVTEPEAEAAAGRLLGWLEHTDKRWLVVLDNLDTPSDAAGWWPPDNRHGRTVVTTRRRDPILHTDGRILIEVDLFTPAEAAAYLTRATGEPAERRADLQALAADLGYLPLALAQAAAFIRDRGTDCATYRQRLADRQQPLADLSPPEDALPDDHRATVAATWSLSIDAADAHSPQGLARPVLNIAALLNPNGIPAAVFTTDAMYGHLGAISGRSIDRQAVIDALRNLHRLNLITHDPAAGAVRVHALVQRATLDDLDSADLAAATLAAAEALLEMWPEIERDPEQAQNLRTNVTALRSSSGDSLLHQRSHPLLWRTIRSIGESGQVEAAAMAFDQLLADCQRVLGPDHPDTLIIRGNVAYWRANTGDHAGAVAAFELLLVDCLRLFGPDHIHTLVVRSNIAYWQGLAGDPSDAADALEQLHRHELRILGPDHPDTLTTRHNIAKFRGEAGDLSGAVDALEQLHRDELRILGPDHPDSLTTRHNIAYWRGRAGDLSGAVDALEQLLHDRLRILGPDHPDTLTTRSVIAKFRGEAGDLSGAVDALEQLLHDRLRILGPDHPDTLSTRSVIAGLRARTGFAAEG
ncbi:tetratricopeptide repeat protein [Micromonospora sp. NPDC049836]|uniref:tetratricopeptide repeat protein n=1 Tax=Micromonospora sp. NPDC049836 TaxID=3364274 RepID=UPI003797FF91